MNTVLTPHSENNIVLLSLNSPKSRSVSPLTPSPSKELKGIRLFRAISRKLSRRSVENINCNGVTKPHYFNADNDSRSSSSDSCSSGTKGKNSSPDSGFMSVSPNHMSSSSSEAGSDVQVRARHHHSTSAESIRKVFRSLSLNSRSRSCNNTNEKKTKSSKKSAPQKILRSPVTYTYIKGLSGLPTQRVPKRQTRLYLNNTCGCNMQSRAGLNR